jgi:hypothetical protein
VGWKTRLQILEGAEILLFAIAEAHSQGLNLLRHKADYSSVFSAKVKNVWGHTSTTP